MWALARMFNPSHAAQHLGPDGVDALYDIQPLAYHNLIVGMKSEVHAYLTACVGVVVDTMRHGGVHQLRLALLAPQRPEVPHVGGGTARIMFAMTPNSASAERVFSLLKAMFGDARASSLSDLIQGSLMLKFNKAKRKAEKEMMEQAAGPN